MRTTQDILNRLLEMNATQMENQLRGMPFKKGVREAYSDGFKSGQVSLLYHLKEMGIVDISEAEDAEAVR